MYVDVRGGIYVCDGDTYYCDMYVDVRGGVYVYDGDTYYYDMYVGVRGGVYVCDCDTYYYDMYVGVSVSHCTIPYQQAHMWKWWARVRIHVCVCQLRTDQGTHVYVQVCTIATC